MVDSLRWLQEIHASEADTAGTEAADNNTLADDTTEWSALKVGILDALVDDRGTLDAPVGHVGTLDALTLGMSSQMETACGDGTVDVDTW